MKQLVLQIAGIFALLAAPAWLIWQFIGWLKEVRKTVQKTSSIDTLQRQVIEMAVKQRELRTEIDRLDKSIAQIVAHLRNKK